ncbi:MAG: bifunctional hydroxymethylpyrimidine kinase/phosphomethylpyrimidine kinase [Lachnospiraceae bacterium]|nr:bifunctional hydroxymethylpyrimidine kinase/phosphomethylpyrimidine kinase [Lachnospiraceae bacterium]
MNVKKILSIAGSDCSGGAGIQADLKTISAHGMYGMSVITSVTAQNTTGVYGVCDMDPDFVGRQIDCVFEDIPPDAVKIGMVSNADIIECIVKRMEQYKPEILVVDPVMVSTSGCMLLENSALQLLVSRLIPLATLITPNIPEAQVLSGIQIQSEADMVQAAHIIYEKSGTAVLVKGGHMTGQASDILYRVPEGEPEEIWFQGERIDNPNTHGTGCTLSSAIACQLAAGQNLETGVAEAKKYIAKAIQTGLNLGTGSGPLWHFV